MNAITATIEAYESKLALTLQSRSEMRANPNWYSVDSFASMDEKIGQLRASIKALKIALELHEVTDAPKPTAFEQNKAITTVLAKI